MELTRNVKYIILFFACLIIVAFYFLLTDQYRPFFRLNKIQSNARQPVVVEGNRSHAKFESRLSTWYPHLPIHVFTQDLSSLSNTTKVILIGNSFFGARNWDIPVLSRSSAEISKRILLRMILSFSKVLVQLQ